MMKFARYGVSVDYTQAPGASPEHVLFMHQQKNWIKKVCQDMRFSFKLAVYETVTSGPYSDPVWVFYCAVKFGGRVIKVHTDRTFSHYCFNEFLILNNNFNPLL
jgi:hypothetical protein